MQRLLPTPATSLSDAELFADAAAPSGAEADTAFVRFSMVTSLDGRASSKGVSAPLSSEADHRRFMILRAAADAMVVGSGTVKAENYHGDFLPEQLQSMRQEMGLTPRPDTVVLSATASISPQAPVFTDTYAPTHVVVAQDAPVERVQALTSALGSEHVIVVEPGAKPQQISAALSSRGLHHLHHEGGPTILSSYLAAGAVDSLCLTLAPVMALDGLTLTSPVSPAHATEFTLHLLYEERSTLLADYRHVTVPTTTTA